jgi:hypothetical protein
MTQRAREKASFEEAAVAIVRILADGQWHKSIDEIHAPLRPWVAEGMFGNVKSRFKMESRREGGGLGSYFVWRLRNPRRDVMLAHLLDEGVPFDLAQALVSEALDGAARPFIDGKNGGSSERDVTTSRGPLLTEIIRNGKPLALRWNEFHVAAMIYACVWDSGMGPFESNEPPDFYDDGEGHEIPSRYPHLPCPITPAESYTVVTRDVIAQTPLGRGKYVLQNEHRFIDMTDGEVLHLLPGDLLRLRFAR